jgi:hypothetical protein
MYKTQISNKMTSLLEIANRVQHFEDSALETGAAQTSSS